MAHRDHDNDDEGRHSERRRRSRAERDPSKSHKSKSSRPKVIDSETGLPLKSRRRHKESLDRDSKRGSELSISMADIVPELSRTSLAPGASSQGSLPYPSFNRAYSKESLNIVKEKSELSAKKSPYTPDPTDLESENLRSKSVEHLRMPKDGRPPTPPETDLSQQRKATPRRMSQVKEDVILEERPSSRSSHHSRISKQEGKSKLSINSKGSKASTAIKSQRVKQENDESQVRDSGIGSGVDSNITSVAPKQSQATVDVSKQPPSLDTDSSPDSAQDLSPQTPTKISEFAPPSTKLKPSPFIHLEAPEAELSAYDSPKPPPPPPPPNVPISIPSVDYLIQNGGLPRPVPKTLITPAPTSNLQQSTRQAIQPPSEIERIFGPYFNTLDQYETVIKQNGSLAVATGYRSVARRLLDRLEVVMGRDLSSEGCLCVMCQHPDLVAQEKPKKMGWGEVLEWSAGRKELPVWPAFDFAMLGVKAADDMAGLGISRQDPTRPGSPVKIDPDVADDFREHYLQQSKKTKIAVDRWLSSCPQTAATPPQEVDDETLSFAILTHLDPHDRPIFNALITGSNVLQNSSRVTTTLRKPRSELMTKTVLSLQRLYRLPVIPRDPEAAIYLLKNPRLHNLLSTMSGINAQEWEILTSGRFDGFLWSGADSEATNPSPTPPRGPTPSNSIPHRGPTTRNMMPFAPTRNYTFSPSTPSYFSRGPTPLGQIRQPVSNDEETEIAVLAEVEREIYLGMEALEDAFEGLHRKAEFIRRALRERGAGLAMSLQSRRALHSDINMATPGLSASGLGPGYERQGLGESSDVCTDSDWEEDEVSELAPDDSASNISSSRYRRPKRRHERRTPALVEEEGED